MTACTRRQQDEGGATLVLVAIAMVAVLIVAGLVLDGGMAYATRRQVQTSADVAATAGARALARLAGGDPIAVTNAVNQAVTDNKPGGALSTTVSCRFVDVGYGTAADVDRPSHEMAACPPASGTSLPLDSAGRPPGGVVVRAFDIRRNAFAAILQASTTTAGAKAAAMALKATPYGDAPIMVCAVASGGGLTGVQMRTSPAGQVPILRADGSLNPAAVAPPGFTVPEYWLKGVEVKDTCNAGNAFKGIVADRPAAFTLPANLDDQTGNHAGPLRNAVAGICNGEAVGCDLVLPLCDNGGGNGANAFLHCVRFGVFRVTFTDSNSLAGVFLGGAFEVLDGSGSTPGGTVGSVDQDPYVVRLVG